MSIPFPGAGLIYAALKDLGRLGWVGLRGRRLPRAEAFQRWTVDKWYGTGKTVESLEVLRSLDDARNSTIR